MTQQNLASLAHEWCVSPTQLAFPSVAFLEGSVLFAIVTDVCCSQMANPQSHYQVDVRHKANEDKKYKRQD